MDNYLPYLGPTITVIGILVATFLSIRFNLWGTRKILTYKIVTKGSLFSADDDIKDKIKVLYEERSVDALSFLIVEIKNSGKAAILKADFDSRIQLNFREEIEILSVEIANVNPSQLQVEIENSSSVISVQPLLLNGGDSFEIKIIISGDNTQFGLDGRIAGVKQIRELESINNRGIEKLNIVLWILLFFGFCMIGIMTDLLFDFFVGVVSKPKDMVISIVGATLVWLIFLALELIRWLIAKRRSK